MNKYLALLIACLPCFALAGGIEDEPPPGEVVSYCLLYDGTLKQALRYDVRQVDSRLPVWASVFVASENWNQAGETSLGAGLTARYETDMGFVVGVSAGVNFENLFRSQRISGSVFIALGLGWRF